MRVSHTLEPYCKQLLQLTNQGHSFLIIEPHPVKDVTNVLDAFVPVWKAAICEIRRDVANSLMVRVQ